MPRYLLDPPNGHAFGFPKPFDGDVETLDFDSWLRENGYPDEWIKMFPNGKACRVVGPLDEFTHPKSD